MNPLPAQVSPVRGGQVMQSSRQAVNIVVLLLLLWIPLLSFDEHHFARLIGSTQSNR